MNEAMTYALGGAAMLLALVFLSIVPHELGHWLAARYYGFRTPVFSIGFGKRQWSWVIAKKWQTEFRLSPFLIGGYVRIPDVDESSGPPAYSVGKRMAVAAGGPAANIIVAVFLLFALVATSGLREVSYQIHVDSLSEELSPAARAGLKPGDVISSVSDTVIRQADDVFSSLKENSAKPVTVNIVRNGEHQSLILTPAEKGTIGARLVAKPEVTFRKLSVLDSFGAAVQTAYNTEVAMFKDLGKAVGIGRKAADERFMGIVGVVDFGAQAFQESAYSFIWLQALLNLNLALMNLLPLPVLDGGHLMFFSIEALRGKPLSSLLRQKLMEVFTFLLLGFAVWLTYGDVLHLFGIG
ncbi:MAG: hypothetical protein C0469_00035 [Cyanobacteria bacterium DS2.3.42]|nr:hypothetical protein [Cyanobacteria bacterium DS2.3.42]